MLAQLLPGTATTYYGEEIGMVDGEIDAQDRKDQVGDKFGKVSQFPHRLSVVCQQFFYFVLDNAARALFLTKRKFSDARS